MTSLDLSALYRRLAADKGMRCRDVARASGLSEAGVSRVLSGGRVRLAAATRDALDIALALGEPCRPDELPGQVLTTSDGTGFLAREDGLPAAFLSRDTADVAANLMLRIAGLAVAPCPCWASFLAERMLAAGMVPGQASPWLDAGGVQQTGKALAAFVVYWTATQENRIVPLLPQSAEAAA